MSTNASGEGMFADPVDVGASVTATVSGPLTLSAGTVVGITGPGGQTATGTYDTGAANESAIAFFTRTAITGRDQSQAVGSMNQPIECRAPGNMDGLAQSGPGCGAVTMSVLYGTDKSGAALFRAIETEQNYDNTSTNEARSAIFSRASVTAKDSSQAVGSMNQPIEARLMSAIDGLAAATPQCLFEAAMITGKDTTGGAVARSVEARILTGLHSATTSLNGLLSASCLFARASGGGTLRFVDSEIPSSVTGINANTVNALYANAVAVGINSSATTYEVVEARFSSTYNGNAPSSMISLLTQAFVTTWDTTGAAVFRTVEGRSYTNLSGAAPGSLIGLEAHAVLFGSDNTGATLLRPVESRSSQNLQGTSWSGTLVGALSLSSTFLKDAQNVQYGSLVGVREISGNSNLIAGVFEARQNGFWAGVQARRFATKHATEGGNLTAQAAYVATTPTLLLANNAAVRRDFIRSLYIGIDSATTNPVRVVVKIDSANRLSAGGTAVTPQNTNSGGGVSGVTSFTENPTATAEGGGTERLYEFIIPSGKGASITISFNDEIIILTTGSYLVYVFDDAGASGPNILWNSSHEEAA